MLQIYNKYNPNANPANTDYPNGSGKDESVSGANDGTPLEMSWYNDMLGFSEALLAQGRLTPSGNADTALVSDRLDGFRLAALRVQTACDYTDGNISLVDVIHVGLDIATVDYVIDRNTLTRWSVGSAFGTVTADDLDVSTGALSGVSGTLSQVLFGTAASLDVIENPSDTGANKVLITGAGGLLSTTMPVILSDVNNINFTSFYRHAAGAANAPDTDFGVGVYVPYTPSSGALRGVNVNFGRTEAHFQSNDGGTLTGWKRLFHSGISATSADISGGVGDDPLTVSGLFGSEYGLGVGQTWQDVTGSRLVGVTYTNTSGKAIVLSVNALAADASDNRITVDGDEIVNADTETGRVTNVNMRTIIPNGSSYVITATDGIISVFELRS